MGEWSGEEILHPGPWSPEEQSSQGSFSNRMGCDGFYLINDYVQRSDYAVNFRGHGVYGWDAEAEHYTMYWVDSMGMAPARCTGNWDGDTLIFHNDGATGKNRYSYTLQGADGFTFRIACCSPGDTQWQPMMTGVYRRSPP